MKNLSLSLSFLFISLFLLQGCSKDSNPVNGGGNNPPSQMIKLDSGYAAGANAKIVLWTTHSLKAGYNKIYAAIYDSTTGASLTEGHFRISATMDMGGGMTHGCPSENQGTENPEHDGMYESAIIFIMPSIAGGTWTITAGYHNHSAPGEPYGQFTKTVTVGDNSDKLKNITTADGSRLFLSYIQPDTPKVGSNNFEFTVHKMNSMTSFPADSSYTIEVKPWMESMGHGSPNNVNPVHSGKGHYKGSVNFTMTGDWRLHLYLNKDGVRDSTYFDLYFN